MAEVKTNRFIKYFPLLLDALRSTQTPIRPAEARAWIRSHSEVPAEDLSRLIENGKQSIFENDVHWARFYLAKANLISSPKRGLWALTPEGVETHLSPEDNWALYVRVRDASHLGAAMDEEKVPAPQSTDEDDDAESYWFVGALWNGVDDQTPRFISEGIWENGYDDQFSELVLQMKPGDRIAIKASFVQKRGLPFDVGGKPVSVMRIKATGTVQENGNNGKTVKVAWDAPFPARDWYFFTYRTTVVKADTEREDAQRLVDFAFRGTAQDYRWFLNQRYWANKYGAGTDEVSKAASELEEAEIIQADDEPAYTVADIVTDGCFLPTEKLQSILDRWTLKKNLILQGPPGTGKTWLAKRLGYALVGSRDRETTRTRLRVVQFHPSLVYEDFVRGWRPAGEGRLELVDGILMESVEAALSEPDRPFVLVIEEINRGNPAQIFGEMLTLLENTKRSASESIELAYRRKRDERVHVPNNLYVIGTMNVADRSLAIVDLALRRRFAFVDLEPNLGPSWHSWCLELGIDDAMLSLIEGRIDALNREIASATSLGPQFRIGHSYVTPDDKVADGATWFRAKVESEIGPLLDEYWYDSPERAKTEQEKLLAELS